MKMRLVGPLAAKRVLPRETLDYVAFSEKHRQHNETSELHVFEKFYAARSLVADGFETYTDAEVSESAHRPAIRVDAVGRKGDALTLVFCEAGETESTGDETLSRIGESDNARAVILAPTGLDLDLPNIDSSEFRSGKIVVEPLGWFGDELDQTLHETLRLIDLLGNETRMRMLAPLFRKTGAKREYRTSINPKLVYKNLATFLETGLVYEVDRGSYELSQLGKSIMADFIAFLERTRKTLDSASKAKEVKSK
jgi:hypothetical protein